MAIAWGGGAVVSCLRLFCFIRTSAKLGLAGMIVGLSLFAHCQVLSQEQQVQVHNLATVTAHSHDPADVLLASLETIIHDKELCCGKDSAPADSLASAGPGSLKDVSARLEGRHLLSDGQPVEIKTQYVAHEMVNGGNLVQMILDQRAALLEWDSHLYVVHGAVFVWESDEHGASFVVIRRLLLWDTRYSDSRREKVFTRGVDDAAKLGALLFVGVAN